MPSPARPVVVVQHQPSVPPGSVTGLLESSGTPHRVLEAWAEQHWPNAEEMSALIVMGGTMNVDELDAFPFLRQSRALMAAAVERRVPTMGVCLGSQMLARVLGSEVRRAVQRNAVFSELELTPEGRNDPVLQPFADGFPVLQFHEDTFIVPSDAVALATSRASGLPQAFRYGDRAYGIQFHFEVDSGIVERWTKEIGAEAMAEEWGTSEAELLQQVHLHVAKQGAAGRELLQRFLGLAEHPS